MLRLLIMLACLAFATNTQTSKSSKKKDKKYLQNELDLSAQKFSKIPVEISYNSKLTKLDLSHNQISSFTTQLDSCKELRALNLSYNSELHKNVSFETLPSKNLNRLSMEGCNLLTLPFGFGRLENLRYLDLSDNNLVVLNGDLRGLTKLEEVDLSRNNLLSIEAQISNWWNLRRIRLEENPDLDRERTLIALTYLDKLEYVSIDKVTKLPKAFRELSVRELEIINSPEIKFKGNLGRNQSIQAITLRNACKYKYTSCFEEIAKSMNLRKVKIDNNWGALPKEIKLLNSIDELDLRCNSIADFSPLYGLKSLRKLDIRGNRVTDAAINGLKKALPKCEIEYDGKASLQTASNWEPLLDKREAERVVISPKNAQVLKFEGARIDVPANAFVNSRGELVQGDVEIEYTSYDNAAKILLSGASMAYDSAGVRYNLSSSGMFEIQGYADGEEVFIADGKELNVELSSRTGDTDYNLYSYDRTTGQWTLLGKDRVDTTANSMSAMNNTSTQNVLSRNDLMALINRLGDNRVLYHHFMPRVKRYRKRGSFTIDIDELKLGRDKNIVKNNSLRYAKKFMWVFEGQNAEAHYEYLKNVVWKESKALWRSYNRLGRLNAYTPNMFSDFTLERSEDGNTYIMSFNYKDTSLSYTVYPLIRETSSKATADRYLKTLDKYLAKQRFDKLDETRKLKRVEARDKVLLAEIRAGGGEMSIEEMKAMRTQSMMFSANPNNRFAMNSTESNPFRRSFSIRGFGLFNCDRISRMIRPRALIANIFDKKDEKIAAQQIHVVSIGANSVYTYYPNQPIVFDAEGDFSIVIVSDTNEFALIKSSDYSIDELTSKKAILRLEKLEVDEMNDDQLLAKITG